jgi:hypothetical protein
MPYYEYEYIVQNLIDILKEKKEAEEGQNDMESQNSQASQMMKQAGKMLPSGFGNMSSGNMPSMSNFPGIPSSMKI